MTRLEELSKRFFDSAGRGGNYAELFELCNLQRTKLERSQAIVDLLSTRQDGKPIIHSVDPEDGTAERLGVVFRYSLDKRDKAP